VKQKHSDLNYDIQHDLGRQVSSQIYEDLVDEKLEDVMMDKFAGHYVIGISIKASFVLICSVW
jgi:hypothetical protein